MSESALRWAIRADQRNPSPPHASRASWSDRVACHEAIDLSAAARPLDLARVGAGRERREVLGERVEREVEPVRRRDEREQAALVAEVVEDDDLRPAGRPELPPPAPPYRTATVSPAFAALLAALPTAIRPPTSVPSMTKKRLPALGIGLE